MTNKEIKELLNNFPCDYCIVLPMCKNKFKKDIVCILISQWIRNFGLKDQTGWNRIHDYYPSARVIVGSMTQFRWHLYDQ